MDKPGATEAASVAITLSELYETAMYLSLFRGIVVAAVYAVNSDSNR